MKNDIVLLQLLDRKDRKDVVCPLTPSTTSSDSSSPVPSSSEEGGAEEVVALILSYLHTFIHSYFHTFILSYFHPFILSYFHTFIIQVVTSFSINHKSSSVIINNSNTADHGSPPSKPMINAIANKYLVFQKNYVSLIARCCKLRQFQILLQKTVFFNHKNINQHIFLLTTNLRYFDKILLIIFCKFYNKKEVYSAQFLLQAYSNIR